MVAAGLLLAAFAPGVWNWIARNDKRGDVLFLIAVAGLVVLMVAFSLIRVGAARLLLLIPRDGRRR